jgi:hypothetical protein
MAGSRVADDLREIGCARTSVGVPGGCARLAVQTSHHRTVPGGESTSGSLPPQDSQYTISMPLFLRLDRPR